MARLAICHTATVPDIKGVLTSLNDEVVIKDYGGNPALSMLWQVDNTPLTPAEVAMVMSAPPVARQLPFLGIFRTSEIDKSVGLGAIAVTGQI